MFQRVMKTSINGQTLLPILVCDLMRVPPGCPLLLKMGRFEPELAGLHLGPTFSDNDVWTGIINAGSILFFSFCSLSMLELQSAIYDQWHKVTKVFKVILGFSLRQFSIFRCSSLRPVHQQWKQNALFSYLWQSSYYCKCIHTSQIGSVF